METSTQTTELLSLARSKDYSQKELGEFERALNFASLKLENKKRLSGELFFNHNLRVGQILVENGAPPEVVLGGILHGLADVKSEQRIRQEFGEEVWHLIKEVVEVREIKSKNQNLQAEALKRILLTTLKDVRVILIKLANKLDNLRHLGPLPPEEQKRISEEVLEVYAPLAYRLGAEKLRVQLEDLAFRIVHPQPYQKIMQFLRASGEQREKNIAEAIKLLQRTVGGKVSIIKIKGRSKHLYSIYKKMAIRGVPLEEQHDLYGIRVIVPTEKDCYILLGLLHENFEPLEDRLKDYIATPKPNLYRSIHTGLKLPHGELIEVQIRTPEMDEFAEEGIAAHWKYKGLKSEESFEKKVSWLKGVLDLQKDSGSKDFLEAANVDVFGDSIYCYTPKGDMKELPVSSTILDFAYAVHEEVGNHAVGGRINGKFVPLRSPLTTGDVIEVVTNKNQRPHRSWIKIVKSASARQKIRKFLRTVEKLPDLHYQVLKRIIPEDQGVLTESLAYPTALCILAKCCSPLPGEEITGLVTKRRIISVHLRNCRAALKEEERWVKVNWKTTFNQKIRFYVVAVERSGLLADLLHTIATAGFEVKGAQAKLLSMGEMECSFLVIPRSLEHLLELVRRVGKVKGVKKIWFE